MSMQQFRNKILHVDAVKGMSQLPAESIPLTVTSPPYDGMRKFGGHEWNFETFAKIAAQLWRITVPGGVIVWVVRDSITNGSESGSSSEQKLYFRDIGFRIHHTMIVDKPGLNANGGTRYGQSIEYAIVFSKGKPRTIRLLADVPSREPGRFSLFNYRYPDGSTKRQCPYLAKPYRRRGPIWTYGGRNAAETWVTKQPHGGLMNEHLARDHIVSWSRPGELVFDPMAGLGTTCKMAMLSDRCYLGMETHKPFAKDARRRVAEARQQYLEMICTG